MNKTIVIVLIVLIIVPIIVIVAGLYFWNKDIKAKEDFNLMQDEALQSFYEK